MNTLHAPLTTDAPGDVLCIGSINADFQVRIPRPPEVSETLLGHDFMMARALRVVLDPSPADRITDTLLALCDVVVPNAGEAARLTGVEVGDVGAAVRAAQRRNCVRPPRNWRPAARNCSPSSKSSPRSTRNSS